MQMLFLLLQVQRADQPPFLIAATNFAHSSVYIDQVIIGIIISVSSQGWVVFERNVFKIRI